MKIQVRQSVFETNSSSTHSLSIFKTSDWERFKNGEMLIKGFPEEAELVEIDSVEPHEIYNPENDDSDWDEYDYFTYEAFVEIGDYETIFKEVGDYTAMSLYGYDY